MTQKKLSKEEFIKLAKEVKAARERKRPPKSQSEKEQLVAAYRKVNKGIRERAQIRKLFSQPMIPQGPPQPKTKKETLAEAFGDMYATNDATNKRPGKAPRRFAEKPPQARPRRSTPNATQVLRRRLRG